MVLEWDGIQWVPVNVAENYAAGRHALHGITGDGVMELRPMPRNPVIGTGRHRKPQPEEIEK